MNLSTLPVVALVASRRLDFRLEPAAACHLPEMAAIYAEQIAAGLGSFEDPLPDAVELGRRLAAVRDAGLPAFVALDDAGRVLGFCWARPLRPIAAYASTVEDSIHVACDTRRHGVGRTLLEALIAACTRQGCRQMIAVVGDARNLASSGSTKAWASSRLDSCRAPERSLRAQSTSCCCNAHCSRSSRTECSAHDAQRQGGLRPGAGERRDAVGFRHLSGKGGPAVRCGPGAGPRAQHPFLAWRGDCALALTASASLGASGRVHSVGAAARLDYDGDRRGATHCDAHISLAPVGSDTSGWRSMMRAASVERRLAAILVADVVGYSRLVEANEAATLEALREVRRTVIDPLLARHHGRVVKMMGDGAIVEFGSVVDAVACAAAIQRGMAESQASVPAAEWLILRIGLNLGDLVVEGDDLLGDGVNVAARLQQLCAPGEVLISGTAYDQLKGKLDLGVVAMGVRRLKNIADPIRVYGLRIDGPAIPRRAGSAARWRWFLASCGALLVLVAALMGWWFRSAQPVLATQPSVAVLPFANLGGDEATGRLADGITEDIITDLSRFRELDVIAQNSTAVYKDRPADVREIGRALNVRYVLEGSIQRQGDQLRVTAQLINASTGTHLWSDRWDRPAADVFAVQTEIAEQAASRIGGGGAIPEAESRAAHRARPTNLSAYELYLLGQHETDRQTEESIANAIRLLEQAVREDPTLARAWVILAWAYSSAKGHGVEPPPEAGAALAAAQRAVELDPMDPDAHAALSDIFGSNGNLRRAKAEIEIALRLNPGDAETLTHYAGWASAFGQPERGAEAADRALRLNPNAMAWAYGFFSYAYFMAGRYDDAVRSIERRSLDSMGRSGLGMRVAIYAAAGLVDEAHRAAGDALARFPDLSIEGDLGDPSWTDVEREKLARALRDASFPACAPPTELAKLGSSFRLPECARPQSTG